MSDTDRNVLKAEDITRSNRGGEWVEVPGTDGGEVFACYIEEGWLQRFGGNDALQALLQGTDDELTAAYLDEHIYLDSDCERSIADLIDADEVRADNLGRFKTFAVGPIVEAGLEVNGLDMYTAGNFRKMERAGVSPSDLSSMLSNGEAGGSSNSTDSDTSTPTAESSD